MANQEPQRPPRSTPPGNALEHMLRIDSLIAGDISEPEFTGGAAAGMHFGAVPWQHGGTYAMTHDTDGDGIPDAFDFYFGPGAFPIGS